MSFIISSLEGVFVIDKNNRVARFRDVKTGITGESEIEVLDNLNVDDEIVAYSFQVKTAPRLKRIQMKETRR